MIQYIPAHWQDYLWTIGVFVTGFLSGYSFRKAMRKTRQEQPGKE